MQWNSGRRKLATPESESYGGGCVEDCKEVKHMKISKIGWIGKGTKLKDIIWEESGEWLISISVKKKPLEMWHESSRPPRKVEVTVEDME